MAESPTVFGVDWNEVFKTLGSTAIVVAALGYLTKTIIDHFFVRDLDAHKADLKRVAERELADVKASADEALIVRRAEFDRQMEAFKVQLATRSAREDRIREEVVRWANPILGSVINLRRRLANVLERKGYLALSPESKNENSAGWVISYDYFLPSTVYLFCQYFCWVRLLEEKLSFELFEKHSDKDRFFAKVRAVGHTLSGYPLAELSGLRGSGDRQVYNLQQRALGETVAVLNDSEQRCMRYSDFLVKWSDPVFKNSLDCITYFVDGLKPTDEHRWRRLALMAAALDDLQRECEYLLQIEPIK